MMYLALGWAYTTQSPLVNRPDEAWHLAYIEYFKQHGTLPVMRLQRMPNAQRARWEPEAHQPPLYYGLVTLLTFNNRMDDADDLYHPNPHYLSTVEGNTNRFAPIAPQAESVLYVGRFVSLIFGALVGAFVYAIARQAEFVTPAIAAVAMAFTILNPQFLFISTAVSNDVPCAAATTWGLWLVLRMMREGVTARRALAFGFAVSIGTLLKLSAFALLGLLPLLALGRILQQRPLRWQTLRNLTTVAIIRSIIVGALPVVVLVGPLFMHNWQVYDDPLTTTAILVFMGPRQTPLSWQQWADVLVLLWKGYWLDFSVGGAAYADTRIYWLPALVTAAGLCGVVAQAWRRTEWRWPLAILVWWVLLVLGALLSLMARTATPLGGGRLLYPAAAALAVLTVVGLARWLSARVWFFIGLVMPFIAVAALVVYLWPQGYEFNFIQSKALPAPQGTFTLAAQARITGYAIEPASVAQGDSANVYIAWEALQPFSENASVFVQLWDMTNPTQPRVVSQVDTYPWLGYGPTRRWAIGQAIIDRYPVKIPAELPTGWRGLVVVGLYAYQTGQRLPLANATGQRLPFDAAPIGWLELK
jgi:4-amino-4-deoxy-L-arabinose transferase-like glycosyltransferase